MTLRNTAGQDRSLQGDISIYLRNLDGGKGPLDGVVIILLVHEGLAERRRAVEACDPEGFELGHRFEPGDPQQVKSCVGLSDSVDCKEAGQNVRGLQRDHAPECDVVVPNVLKLADTVR